MYYNIILLCNIYSQTIKKGSMLQKTYSISTSFSFSLSLDFLPFCSGSLTVSFCLASSLRFCLAAFFFFFLRLFLLALLNELCKQIFKIRLNMKPKCTLMRCSLIVDEKKITSPNKMVQWNRYNNLFSLTPVSVGKIRKAKQKVNQ